MAGVAGGGLGEVEAADEDVFLEDGGLLEDVAVGGDQAAVAVGAGQVGVGGGVGLGDEDVVFGSAGLDLSAVGSIFSS